MDFYTVSWVPIFCVFLVITLGMLAIALATMIFCCRWARTFFAAALALLSAVGIAGMMMAAGVAQENSAPTPPKVDELDASSSVPGDEEGPLELPVVDGESPPPTDEPVKLSVRPEVVYRVIDAENRPPWVEREPIRYGKVHSTVVCSDPKVSERDSRKALELKIKEATDDYINDYLHSEMAATLLAYDTDSILSDLVGADNIYMENIEVSVGPMYQSHALVEFDEAFRQELDGRWSQLIAQSRILNVGVVAASVLALLGVIFAYFRLDTATRGYYTGRLQFVAAIAILALIASGVLLATWIPWM